jgi:hypothetical protein
VIAAKDTSPKVVSKRMLELHQFELQTHRVVVPTVVHPALSLIRIPALSRKQSLNCQFFPDRI